ncbi:non-ribosomal peptide synthetase [Albimonas pacifica]|uniref:Amino acid adenylation domain-containing protein n=1 Tax=Albimonas pacifica TaxID=1114924 RepID=A0A1I3DBE2_9RHOB|nr:non-ribosomal peptide synthetase [Albimonas pacifica]SFH84023.1 amino acid adenylation domain-containing protein [Albimonas pacifica]
MEAPGRAGPDLAALRARVAGLSAAQREALRAKVEAAGIAWSQVAPEPPARPARLPLSPAQMQFWLMQTLRPHDASFAIAFAWEIEGPLDAPALRGALTRLVARHEALRTLHPQDDDGPRQEIPPPAPFAPEEAAPADPDAAERAFVARPFDLANDLPIRATLLRLGEGRARLMVSIHHIAADGWSRGILLRELAADYAALRDGEPGAAAPPAQFADLALAQADWLQGPEARAQEAFWREQLAGLSPPRLPEAPGAEGSADRRAETSFHRLPPDLAARVAPAAAALGATPFTLLLAVFQLLQHRLTGADDLSVGVPSAGRDGAAAGTVGLFVNTLVHRARPRAGLSFRDWTAAVHAGFLRAFDRQALPFARVVEATGAPRRPDRTPLFQTLFQVQWDGYARQNADAVDLGDPRLRIRQRPIPLAETKFDLTWTMMSREDGLVLIVERRAALYDAGFVARMAAQFETLLAAALDRPEAAIETLEWRPPAQRAAAVLTGPSRPIPDLADLLAPPAGAEPALIDAGAAPALIDLSTGETLDAAALHAAADHLARALRARPELAGPGACLGLCLPRRPSLVVAMLAALKAGIPYVPLDPAHPAARRDAALIDAGVGLLLAEEEMSAPCPVVDPTTLEAPEAPPLPRPSPDALAYLIFTSGSTGRPKGVPISRRALANLLAATLEGPGPRAGDRMLALTTVAFDIAALEILAPLAAGATVALADRDHALDPDRLSAALDRHAVTHMQATPAAWRLLVEAGWPGRPGLTALCGGEALPADLARALAPRVGALWNMYGPTETTIWSAALKLEAVEGDAPVPIGGPLANTTLRILDRHGQALPEGVPGELVIGGAGLSAGYHRRPDLTAERFVEIGGERVYRTGDLARLEAGGRIAFLGRLDHQIKLDGHRIEPGEIEAALTARADVAEALVMVRDGRLTAWLRPQGARAPSPAELRADLAARLPAYMVPGAFVALEAFPLNANGKIDRARLPDPEAAAPRDPGRPPATPEETALQAIWAEVLGRETVGVEENFFDLGGASISAMRIAARARAQGLMLAPAQMFAHQTVAAQAAAARAAASERLPFTPAQHAQPPEPRRRLRVPTPGATPSALAAAVAALREAHAVLRLTAEDDAWRPDPAAEAPAWQAHLDDERLELTVDPRLLDAPSTERLALALAAHLRGEALDLPAEAPAARPAQAAPRLDPLPHRGGAGTSAPVFQTLAEADLAAFRAEVRRSGAPESRLAAAALARTLSAWQGGGAVSLALLATAPLSGLGHALRLLPLRLTEVPTDPAAALRAVQAAAETGDVDPRALPEGLAVLEWTQAPAAGVEWIEAPAPPLPPSPALHLAVEAGPAALRLTWRGAGFEPAGLARLAARGRAELLARPAPTAPPARGPAKLDRLRARLVQPGG